MITSLAVPIWSQRDPRWKNQRLGIVNGTTLGGQGCLDTTIAMANAAFKNDQSQTPNVIDDLFTNNGGYANGNLVIWNAINRLLPDMSTQGQILCANTAAPVADIQAKLDAGMLAILQVGFGGVASNMHFLLAVGYDTGIDGQPDIIFHDPWYGDQSQFSSKRYGTGIASRDILAIHYFADGSPAPVKPVAPVAQVPAPATLQGFQREVVINAFANYRQEPNTTSAVLTKFPPNSICDFKGYVTNGQNINGNSTWFVGKLTGHYAWSGDFQDTGTHDLQDLTPEPPAPEPTLIPVIVTPQADPQPEPAPEPVIEPQIETTPQVNPQALEELYDWRPDATIPQKVVSVPSADVVDVTTGKTITTLHGGDLVKPLGGYFTVNGTGYFRTIKSVEAERWYGISQTEVKDYVAPEPIGNGLSLDGIHAPEYVPQANPDDLINSLTDEPSSSLEAEAKLKAIAEYILGILASPLRLIALINKNKKEN